MSQEDINRDESIDVAINELKNSIEKKKQEIKDLEKAIERLHDLDTKKTKRTTSGKRLRRGVPQRYTKESFKSKKIQVIGDIIDFIRERYNYSISDTTVRRALGQLEKDGVVISHDDGRWELVDTII